MNKMDKLIIHHKAKTLIVIVIIVITEGPPEVDERRSRAGAWRVQKGSVMPTCTTRWHCIPPAAPLAGLPGTLIWPVEVSTFTHCWLTVIALSVPRA